MRTPCNRCRLLFCDFISRECLATPAQVAQMPDLIQGEPIPEAPQRVRSMSEGEVRDIKAGLLAVLKRLNAEFVR